MSEVCLDQAYKALPASNDGDPYQNSHGEKVYTMVEFLAANEGLSR